MPMRSLAIQQPAFPTFAGCRRLPRRDVPTWASATPQADARIVLPPIAAPTEGAEPALAPADGPAERVGFALVGLGHLTLDRLMPAFGKTRHCKPVALVSGDPAKAATLAAQHGIPTGSIYGYDDFDRIADNPAVQVVYIVLPNSLHAEFTLRAARAGKHVLCEKPMAPSVADCQAMIDACAAAHVQLMIAYRSQYEPHNLAVVEMVGKGELGVLKGMVTTNSQNMGDPGQWRLKQALSGGGVLPDIGIYCLNAARVFSGEEPVEVVGRTWSTPGDERFTEVEESVNFLLRFPSGFEATCHASYAAHKSQMLRLLGSTGWVELDPAYAYDGIRMRRARVVGGQALEETPTIPEQDQFALEMDHMATCVQSGATPASGGAEGLQDQRIIEAIYASARDAGRAVKLAPPPAYTRGRP